MMTEPAISRTIASFVVGVSGRSDEHRVFTAVVVAQSQHDLGQLSRCFNYFREVHAVADDAERVS